MAPVAYFVLGEKLASSSAITLPLCLIGVMLVVQPPFLFPSEESNDSPLGYILTIGNQAGSVLRNDDVAMVLNGAFAPTHRNIEISQPHWLKNIYRI